MPNSLIDQGLSLMLYGMGTVFVFLTILVFATLLMSRIVARFASNQVAATEPMALRADDERPSPAVKQAIKLAIAKHRQR